MKKLIILLILLPFVVSAQKKKSDDVYGSSTTDKEAYVYRTDTIPFHGVKKITVNTGLPAKEGYMLAANTLMDNGFTIEFTDNTLFMIKTKNGSHDPNNSFYLNIRATDNEVSISGKQAYFSIVLAALTGETRPIENLDIIFTKKAKRSKNQFQESFEHMEGFAKKLNKPLIYSN